jgi:hypothetical protein
MKEKIEKAGWTCVKCGCPGRKGWDCAHKSYRGYIVQLREYTFKILNKGHVIESAHLYQLEKKMKEHGLTSSELVESK